MNMNYNKKRFKNVHVYFKALNDFIAHPKHLKKIELDVFLPRKNYKNNKKKKNSLIIFFLLLNFFYIIL